MFTFTKAGARAAAFAGLVVIGTAVVALISFMPTDWAVQSGWIPASWAKAVAGLGLASPTTLPPVSTAALEDHAFELIQDEVKQGETLVDVRLTDRRSGKPVPDAVIFAQRVDMAPDGMPTMTAPIDLTPSPEPGIYRFKTNLMMEGGWQLSLAAKVQGESGTVQSRHVLKAVP